MLAKELKFFLPIQWIYLIVDEAHKIKNDNSKMFESLSSIKTFHKLILTGTPVQNDIGELWSLLCFLHPEKFGNKAEFTKLFGELKEAEQVKKLHETLAPYLLRRMKEDVAKNIPAKIETLVHVELTNVQKTFCRAVLDKNREFLRAATSHNKTSLINIMMQVRKTCNHPYLIQGAEDKIKLKSEDKGELFNIVRSSSKMILLDKMLKKFKCEGRKVLLFSQMTMMLDIIEDYMNYSRYSYVRLDGGTNRIARQTAIDSFRDPKSKVFVFLLSTKAGGLGLNLQTSDTIIIFDSDWNPQNDLQACARSHRIGQTKVVQIYRYITKGTYEEYMFDVASKKLGLDHVVLNGSTKGSSATLGTKEIDRLLKYGAYHLNETEGAEEKLLEEDIDSILQKRSTVVNHDKEEQEKATTNLLGSSFSKATFSVENGAKVDLEDEQFWDKILPHTHTTKSLLKFYKKRNSDFDFRKFVEDLSHVLEQVKEDQASKSLFSGGEAVAELGILMEELMADSSFSEEESRKIEALNKVFQREINTRRRKQIYSVNSSRSSSGSLASLLAPKKRRGKRDATEISSISQPEENDGTPEETKELYKQVLSALLFLGPHRPEQVREALNEKFREISVEKVLSICEQCVHHLLVLDPLPLVTKVIESKEGEEKEKLQQKQSKYQETLLQSFLTFKCNTIYFHYRSAFKTSSTEVPFPPNCVHLFCDELKGGEQTFLPGQSISIHVKVAREELVANSSYCSVEKLFVCFSHNQPDHFVKMVAIDNPFAEGSSSITTCVPGFVGKYSIHCISMHSTQGSFLLSSSPPALSFRVPHLPFLSSGRFFPLKMSSFNEIFACFDTQTSIFLTEGNYPKFSASRAKMLPFWWNEQCDVALLKGTLKHGFKRYHQMRQDKLLGLDDASVERYKLERVVFKKEGSAQVFPPGNVLTKRLQILVRTLKQEMKTTKAIVDSLSKLAEKNSQKQREDFPHYLPLPPPQNNSSTCISSLTNSSKQIHTSENLEDDVIFQCSQEKGHNIENAKVESANFEAYEDDVVFNSSQSFDKKPSSCDLENGKKEEEEDDIEVVGVYTNPINTNESSSKQLSSRFEGKNGDVSSRPTKRKISDTFNQTSKKKKGTK